MDTFPSSIIRPFLRSGKSNAYRVIPEVLSGELRIRPIESRCLCGGNHEKLPLVTLERPIFFVFQAGSSGWGSVRLRVIQMARNLKAVVANPSFVRVVTEERLWRTRPQEADIVFSKFSVRDGNLAWMQNLVRGRNRILVDLVDGWGIDGLETIVTAYICASRSEYEFRIQNGLDAYYVPHQVDHRWPYQDFTAREFGVGYFGAPGGARFLDHLDLVATEFTGLFLEDSEIPRVIDVLSPISHHYSVRVFFGEGNFKDATKAYVAARFGAVFVGSKEDEESLLVLGAGYPYLATTSSRDDVVAILEFARATFLGPEWRDAVETMRRLRKETCDLFNGHLLASCLAGTGPSDFWEITRG